MSVLYWTQLSWPYIGGVEVHTLKFLPALQARGCEFVVVTSHGSLSLSDQDEYEGVTIYRFHFQTTLAKRNMDQLIAAKHAWFSSSGISFAYFIFRKRYFTRKTFYFRRLGYREFRSYTERCAPTGTGNWFRKSL